MSHRNEKLQSTRSEKSLSTKEKFTKATAATLIAIGALSLAACSDEKPTESTPPTATETVEPTIEPSPEVTPEEPDNFGYEVLTRTPIPENLVQYQEMSPEDFAKLPKAEQWKYAEYLTQYRSKFTEIYSSLSGHLADKVSSINPDSDGWELVAYNLYTLRMALYSTEGEPSPNEDGTCGPLDMDTVEKIILAGSESRVYYLNSVDVITNVGNAICAEEQATGRYFSADSYTSAEVTEKGVEEYQGQEVNYSWVNYTRSGDSTEYRMKFYIYPVDTENGQEYRTILNRHGEWTN